MTASRATRSLPLAAVDAMMRNPGLCGPGRGGLRACLRWWFSGAVLRDGFRIIACLG